MRGISQNIVLFYILSAVFVSPGCAVRSTGVERTEAFQDALNEADKAWKRRGRDGLKPVEEALKEVLRVGPKRPAGLWRMSRLYASKGWATESEQERREYFLQSRYFGERCLMTNAAFSGRQAQYGWGVALNALDGFDACTVWLFHSWAAYSAEVGRSALVDVTTLQLLADHTAGSSFGAATQAWGVALLAILAEDGQLPSNETGLKYERAMQKSKSLALRLDYVDRWIRPAKGASATRTHLLDIVKKKAATPEDVTAQQQAKILLEDF